MMVYTNDLRELADCYVAQKDEEFGLLNAAADELDALRQQVERLERSNQRLMAERNRMVTREQHNESLKALAATESRLRELEGSDRKVIGWRTDNFLHETSDRETAINWEPNFGVLPIFDGDPNTQLAPVPPAEARPVDWRAHSAQFARGESPPQNLETAQAAWARDQELIFEQRDTIAKQSQTINQLRQARPVVPEELEQDARRYRWLLQKVCMIQTASYGCKFEILNLPPHFGDCEVDPRAPFNAAIDQAMDYESLAAPAAQEQEKGE